MHPGCLLNYGTDICSELLIDASTTMQGAMVRKTSYFSSESMKVGNGYGMMLENVVKAL